MFPSLLLALDTLLENFYAICIILSVNSELLKFCISVINYYASVGGATRHTVVRRFVIRSFIHSLCLGGRSHEAYCNRVVCLSVVMPRWAEPRGIL